MARPLAICLEDLEPRGGAPRYLRCVAVVGRAPGLRVDRVGTVLWKSDEAVACELCVSLDDKLILLRPEGAAPVTVRREGRSLDVPAGKPVVLLDQDRFEVGGRRLRIHVHGATDRIAAPSPLPEPAGTGRVRAAAAVAALGAALGAADCKKEQPARGEAEAQVTPAADAVPQDAASAVPDATGLPPQEVLDASAQGPDGEPIEVRVAPPTVARLPEPDVAPPPPDAAAPPPPDAVEPPPPDAAEPPPSPDTASPPPDAGPDETLVPLRPPPIEVREHPPIAVDPTDFPGRGSTGL